MKLSIVGTGALSALTSFLVIACGAEVCSWS